MYGYISGEKWTHLSTGWPGICRSSVETSLSASMLPYAVLAAISGSETRIAPHRKSYSNPAWKWHGSIIHKAFKNHDLKVLRNWLLGLRTSSGLTAQVIHLPESWCWIGQLWHWKRKRKRWSSTSLAPTYAHFLRRINRITRGSWPGSKRMKLPVFITRENNVCKMDPGSFSAWSWDSKTVSLVRQDTWSGLIQISASAYWCGSISGMLQKTLGATWKSTLEKPNLPLSALQSHCIGREDGAGEDQGQAPIWASQPCTEVYFLSLSFSMCIGVHMRMSTHVHMRTHHFH